MGKIEEGREDGGRKIVGWKVAEEDRRRRRQWGESWEEIWLPCKSRYRRREKRGMEGCDDGCAALVSCPLTKTLISVCVIPHCLLRLLILINYIHLPLPPSIPFSRPPSLCPPKITYWLSEPHLDQTCFYLLTLSLSFPSSCHSLFLPLSLHPFTACVLLPYDVSLPLFSSRLTLKKKFLFFCSASLSADRVSAWPA